MTQTAIPPEATEQGARAQLSVHGTDPGTGIPMTWHISRIENGGYLIEWAEGDIHSPAVWMQARRDASVVGEAEMLELVRRVMLT